MKIKYKITSRSSMIITFNDKKAIVYGELTFEPSVFYVDLNSFKNWEPPFENEKISENEKIEITQYLKNSKNSTKFIFE